MIIKGKHSNVKMWEQISMFCHLLFSLQIFNTFALEIPNFVEPIANVSIATGRNTMLECTVNNLGNYKVAWLKMDSGSDPTLLAIHTQTLVQDSRFRVSHNNHKQWYLHINNVHVTDKGYYMCQINAESVLKQVGYLDVLVPPSIVESDTTSDTIVDERQKLSLRCRSSGYPSPTVTWRREDSRELNLGLYGGKKYSASKVDGEYLNITQVTRDDMGAYLCIASNGVPPSVSKRMIVQVNFRPKIKVQNQLVGASLGSDVHLECRCEASPTPMTSWIRNDGVILLPTVKYQITEEHDSYRTRMKLKITRLEEKDFGSYKCVAKNTLGEKEGLVRLYEIPAPTMPTHHHSKQQHFDGSASHKNAKPHEFTNPFHTNLSATAGSLMNGKTQTKQDMKGVGNTRESRAQKNGNSDKEMSDDPNTAIGIFYSCIPTLLLLIVSTILNT